MLVERVVERSNRTMKWFPIIEISSRMSKCSLELDKVRGIRELRLLKETLRLVQIYFFTIETCAYVAIK